MAIRREQLDRPQKAKSYAMLLLLLMLQCRAMPAISHGGLGGRLKCHRLAIALWWNRRRLPGTRPRPARNHRGSAGMEQWIQWQEIVQYWNVKRKQAGCYYSLPINRRSNGAIPLASALHGGSSAQKMLLLVVCLSRR
uniref:Putative secreted protein n=1 Tax=Anopheles marajoara TaxID=58244 RepID=A0A2M4C6Q5_9DIPT